jgi:hypothetical protein
MPAINPERLKEETVELALTFADPSKFIYSVTTLLDRYADRVRRHGQSGAPAPLLPSYNVATPVMRQIVLTLTPLALDSPHLALTIIDVLWEQPMIETRQIAIHLLGTLPSNDPDPILERLKSWANPKEEESILDELFRLGIGNIHINHPDLLLDIIQDWLNSDVSEVQTLGAKALLPLADNPAFENFPLVYRLLFPCVIDAPSVLRPHLVAVIRVLAVRSPQETAHFLHQVLVLSDRPGATWIARQCFELFSEDVQDRLKETIRNR